MRHFVKEEEEEASPTSIKQPSFAEPLRIKSKQLLLDESRQWRRAIGRSDWRHQRSGKRRLKGCHWHWRRRQWWKPNCRWCRTHGWWRQMAWGALKQRIVWDRSSSRTSHWLDESGFGWRTKGCHCGQWLLLLIGFGTRFLGNNSHQQIDLLKHHQSCVFRFPSTNTTNAISTNCILVRFITTIRK